MKPVSKIFGRIFAKNGNSEPGSNALEEPVDLSQEIGDSTHQDSSASAENVTIDTQRVDLRGKISKKMHWVVFTTIALAIGGLNFYSMTSSAKSEAQASEKSRSQKNAPTEAIEVREELAKQTVSSLQRDQEEDQEKARKKAEEEAAKMKSPPHDGTKPSSPVAATSSQVAPSYGSPIQSNVNSSRNDRYTPTPLPLPSPKDGSASPRNVAEADGAALPPVPVAKGTSYSPKTLSNNVDTSASANVGRIIVLTGSGAINAEQGGTPQVVPNLGAVAPQLGLTAVQQAQQLAAQAAAVSSSLSPIVSGAAGMGTTRSFPATTSADQLRALLLQIAAQQSGVNTAVSSNGGSLPLPNLSTTPGAIPKLTPQGQSAGQAATEGDIPLTAIPYNGKLVLRQGSLIPAVSQSGINSDLAGEFTAVVSENVYDSVEGMTLLIPKGSKLIASYGNAINIGQERLMLNFTRLMLPNGAYVNLRSMNGVDSIGQSGVPAEVNNHFFKMFGAGFIGAIVTWVADKNSSTSVTVSSTSTDTAVKSATADAVDEVSQRILDRYKSLSPTLTVEPGSKMKLFVKTDMQLEAYIPL